MALHCYKSCCKPRYEKRTEIIRFVFVCFACVRQNLIFRAIFESVSDDKYFLLPCVNKKDHYFSIIVYDRSEL